MLCFLPLYLLSPKNFNFSLEFSIALASHHNFSTALSFMASNNKQKKRDKMKVAMVLYTVSTENDLVDVNGHNFGVKNS